MPLAVGAVIECVASWYDGPELAEIIFHHKVTESPSEDSPQAVSAFATAAQNQLEDLTETCMTPTTILVGCSCRVLGTGSGAGQIHSVFSAVVGEVTGPVSGAQSCVLLSKYTNTVSKSGRGRAFIPFVPQSFHESGQLTNDARTLYLAALYPLFLNGIDFGSGGESDPVVYSRKDSTGRKIEEAVLRPVLCTQRRRVIHKQPFYPAV